MNHLYQVNIFDIEKIVQVYGGSIENVNYVILFSLCKIPHDESFMAKKERIYNKGVTISPRRNSYILPIKFRAKSEINII